MRREVTVHVVRETIGRQWLLPAQRSRDRAIVEIVARAVDEHAVDLHAVSVLGNRVELLLSGTEPETRGCADHVHERIAALIAADPVTAASSRSVWNGRACVDVVWGLRQQEALWDLHAGPVELGLVSHPTHWRGVTSARALVGGPPVRAGRWKLPLTPVPVLASLQRDARIDVVRRIFDAIARGAAAARVRHADARRPGTGRVSGMRTVSP